MPCWAAAQIYVLFPVIFSPCYEEKSLKTLGKNGKKKKKKIYLIMVLVIFLLYLTKFDLRYLIF